MLAATRTAPGQSRRPGPVQPDRLGGASSAPSSIAEVPDSLALVGIVLIGLSGLFTFLREDKVTELAEADIYARPP